MKNATLFLVVVFVSGCASNYAKPEFEDVFGRQVLHSPKIPSCSAVTLKGDVKECVVR